MLQRLFKLNCIKEISNRYLHIRETNVGIIGVPCEKGQKLNGVELGPQALRNGGLIEELKNLHENMNVKDYGNVTYSLSAEACNQNVSNMWNYPHISACNFQLSRSTEQIIGEGRICLTLGGDHSIAVGSIDGHIKAKQDVCILWVDAHTDLNTNDTSGSGNVHGMSMALLASELSDHWPQLPGMEWLNPKISLKNLAYIGLRSVDPYEKFFIDKFDVAAFDMEDIDKLGIRNVISLALDRIDPNKNKSIHVSFDIDALDPIEAPSTGTAVSGGLTLREAIQIMETIHNTGRLGAMDLVELNPAIGTREDARKTVDAATHIILGGFGRCRRGLVSKQLTLAKKKNENIT